MSVRSVHVNAASASYDVLIGEGLLDEVGPRLSGLGRTGRVFIVTDSNVAPLYLDRVAASLEDAGFAVSSTVFPAGEESKNLSTLGLILEEMAQAGLTRTSTVIALGGGVTGDMAGLAAGLYMRGIAYVQMPTTVLAMVDSSVGGKCAVDLAHGKNLAGVFLQPKAVLADVACLKTLSDEVFCDGCAEIVKHAVLASPELFEELAAHPLSKHDAPERLARIIACNVDIKRSVVESDERESGPRKLLNLGHSIGHAVEAASKFALGHGHAVAIGLAAICRASEKRGWTSLGTSERVETALAAQGLPTASPYEADDLIAYAHLDKKRTETGIDLVIAEHIGSCTIRNVDLAEFDELIRMGA